MKRYIVSIILILGAAVLLYAASEALPGGPFPAQGQAVGGKGDDGKFYPFHTDNLGNVETIAASNMGLSPVKSSAKEASHVLKSSAGYLISAHGSCDTDSWLLITDSATVPVDGPVTLLYPPIHISANGNFSVNFTTPLKAANGVAISKSNANSFTKALQAADCIFAAQVQ